MSYKRYLVSNQSIERNQNKIQYIHEYVRNTILWPRSRRSAKWCGLVTVSVCSTKNGHLILAKSRFIEERSGGLPHSQPQENNMAQKLRKGPQSRAPLK